MHWGIYTFAPVGLVVVVALAYRVGKVWAESRIVGEFDEIIFRIRSLVQSRNYAGLELFLHDLTEDTPPSKSRLDRNFPRTNKEHIGINKHQGGESTE